LLQIIDCDALDLENKGRNGMAIAGAALFSIIYLAFINDTKQMRAFTQKKWGWHT